MWLFQITFGRRDLLYLINMKRSVQYLPSIPQSYLTPHLLPLVVKYCPCKITLKILNLHPRSLQQILIKLLVTCLIFFIWISTIVFCQITYQYSYAPSGFVMLKCLSFFLLISTSFWGCKYKRQNSLNLKLNKHFQVKYYRYPV